MADFTDFHVHLQDAAFHDDYREVLARARDSGVKRFVCNGTQPADWAEVLHLASSHEDIVPCWGLHPWFLNVFPSFNAVDAALDLIPDLISRYLHDIRRRYNMENMTCRGKSGDAQPSAAFTPGIGEIGLDRALRQRDDRLQEYALERQLELARDLSAPVMLHTVRSGSQILKKLQSKSSILFILHAFIGNTVEIEKFAALGGYFSVSAAVMQSTGNRMSETVSRLPLDRILVESDAPAFAPQDIGTLRRLPIALCRLPGGKLRNEPCVIPSIIERIAVLRKLPYEEMAARICENEASFFKKWPTIPLKCTE